MDTTITSTNWQDSMKIDTSSRFIESVRSSKVETDEKQNLSDSQKKATKNLKLIYESIQQCLELLKYGKNKASANRKVDVNPEALQAVVETSSSKEIKDLHDFTSKFHNSKVSKTYRKTYTSKSKAI